MARGRPPRAKFPLYHTAENLSSIFCKKIAQIFIPNFVQYSGVVISLVLCYTKYRIKKGDENEYISL